jgi:quercetin dioxygenase-like cupin family protein
MCGDSPADLLDSLTRPKKICELVIQLLGLLSHYWMKGALMTLQTIEQATASDLLGREISNQEKYVPAGTGSAYWGPGDRVTFLITGEETGGAYSLAEVLVPPGGGVPPHFHQLEDETFLVLEGEVTIHVGGMTQRATSGDLVFLPRGIVHYFENTGNADAKFLVLITPAGLEKFFEEAFVPVAGSAAPRPVFTEAMLRRALETGGQYGLVFFPPAVQ